MRLILCAEMAGISAQHCLKCEYVKLYSWLVCHYYQCVPGNETDSVWLVIYAALSEVWIHKVM